MRTLSSSYLRPRPVSVSVSDHCNPVVSQQIKPPHCVLRAPVSSFCLRTLQRSRIKASRQHSDL